jgi:hypothetical protein
VLTELGGELVDGFVRFLQFCLVDGDLTLQSFDRRGGVPGFFFAAFDLGLKLADVGRLPAKALEDELLLASVDRGEFDRLAQMPDPEQALQLVFPLPRVFRVRIPA